MEIALILLTGTLVVVGTVVTAMSHAFRDRWGVVRGRGVLVAASPYREATVTTVHPRGVPPRARWAAGFTIGWALVTMLVFVPAGALFVLVAFDQSDMQLGGLLVGVLSMNGLVLGIAQIVSAVRLLRGDLREVRSRIPTWSLVHHAAVAILFFVMAAIADDASLIVAWLGFVALPCAIGAAQAVHFERTAVALHRLRTQTELDRDTPTTDLRR